MTDFSLIATSEDGHPSPYPEAACVLNLESGQLLADVYLVV